MINVLTEFRCYRKLSIAIALAFSLALSPASTAQETRLPNIGGTGGGLISGQQESDIGQQVMVSIRRSAPRITDPLIYDYLSSVIYRLVPSAPWKTATSPLH